MIFTKEHQYRLIQEFTEDNKDCTSKEIDAYMKGIEKGIELKTNL